MFKNQFKILLVLSLFILSITACKKDEKDQPKPKKNTSITLISSSEILDGNITVKKNPSGLAPLTASLKFTTKKTASSAITVLGKLPIYKSFSENSAAHEIPVLGLYAGKNNAVVLTITTATNYSIDTLYIQTDSINQYLPKIEIITADTSQMEEGMTLNTLSITNGTHFVPYPMVYDRNGDIRWYLDFESQNLYTGFRAPMEIAPNGNLFFETGNSIVEYDFMGNKMKEVYIPNGYSNAHHDVYIKPNGNYLIGVNSDTAKILLNGSIVNTVEDNIIEIDGNSGTLINAWDMRDILDVNRDALMVNNGVQLSNDWFHMNAVVYSESDDCLIISGRNQAIVKVDKNNQLKWILAPHKGWGNAGARGNGSPTAPYLLTAVNGAGQAYDSLIQDGTNQASNFDWNWGQHAPLIKDNGNILLFDNGYGRNFGNGSDYSRAVEYKIDENNMKVQQIWQYGKNRGTDTYSSIISDVDVLKNTNNVLFSPGIVYAAKYYAKSVEVTYPSGNVVFEAKVEFRNTRSTGSGFGQYEINYRAERITLYH